jgi:hypothetical protein
MQPSHPMLHFSSPFQVFQTPLYQSSQWTREMSDQQCVGVPLNLSGCWIDKPEVKECNVETAAAGLLLYKWEGTVPGRKGGPGPSKCMGQHKAALHLHAISTTHPLALGACSFILHGRLCFRSSMLPTYIVVKWLSVLDTWKCSLAPHRTWYWKTLHHDYGVKLTLHFENL